MAAIGLVQRDRKNAGRLFTRSEALINANMHELGEKNVNDAATNSKGWTIALWAAQLLLAAAYGLFGAMKATQPLDQLAAMMTWIPDFPPLFVRALGLVEIAGAVGLILPSLTRIYPRLTVVAALCILIHQFCAVALHLSKGETNVLGLNVILIGLAASISWGRQSKAAITARG